MQNTISTILANTSCFPNVRHNCDSFYDDGYIISDENKLLIDDCLKNFPESLFMHDLPEKTNDEFEKQEYRTYSALAYACRTCRTFGCGWGISFVFESLTSIMAYLIEQGAGIGMTERLPQIDLSRMSPQLFVGSIRSKLHGNEESQHVFNYKDILRLNKDKRLSNEDMMRLNKQASNGLRYGNFNSEINTELIKIKRILEMIHLFSDEQLVAYAEYKTEFQITLLQALHQLQELNFPSEITYAILGQLSGLKECEILDMSNKMIEDHQQKFPAFKLR